MDDRYIFLNTLNDIREKLKGEKYHFIKACGLLRHLFLDETPLIHSINREFKIPILFHVSNYKTEVPVKPDFHWRTLSPETVVTFNVKLNEFLKIILLTYQQHEYSVQDVIKSASHLMGGIHLQKAKDEKEKMFLDLDKIVPIQADYAMMAIYAICTVSLNALLPLEEKLK